MKGTRWAETRDALLEIAEHALLQNSDEIDMRFLNSPLIYRKIKVLLYTPSLLVVNIDINSLFREQVPLCRYLSKCNREVCITVSGPNETRLIYL